MQERNGYYWDVIAWRNSRRVRAMDKVTKAIYREVMDEIWINGAVPNDVNEIAILSGWSIEEVTHSWPFIHGCLVPTKKNPDLFTSERLEEERRKRNSIKSKRKKASDERWKRYALAMQMHSTSTPSAMQDYPIQVTSTSNKKQVTSIKEKAPVPGFTEFWEEYPRKTAKEAALKAWNKLAPDPDLLTEILVAVARQKKSDQWRDEKFIPHAATWLNQKRWKDEFSIRESGPKTIAEVLKANA